VLHLTAAHCVSAQRLTGIPDKITNSVTWSTLSIDRPRTNTLIVGYESTVPFNSTP
jgi:hypothetical protein